MFWSAWDVIISYAGKRCGPDSANSINSSFELAFPGIRSECPGYGSLTCEHWYIIPILLFTFVLLSMLVLFFWAVIMSVKYYQMRYKQIAYYYEAPKLQNEQPLREKTGLLNNNDELMKNL